MRCDTDPSTIHRLFMTHGQAAHRPDVNSISERVALELFKELGEAGNRKNRGKTFGIPQSIVITYGHIKQLIEDCKDILEQTSGGGSTEV